MHTTDITQKIRRFMIEEFEVEEDKITPQANLKLTLGLDSLDYIDLVVIIESTFRFKVKPEDFMAITTYQDFCDYVTSRVKQKELV